MKKRMLTLILALAMVLPMVACSSSDDSTSSSSSTSTSSSEPTYKWSVAHSLAVGSSWDLGMLKFAELLNERSDGDIELTVYASGTLTSSPKATYEAVQMGSLEFGLESSASLSTFTDAMNIYDMPYLFPNADVARIVLAGDTAQGQMDLLEDCGMKGISYFENGIYAVGCTTPIESLADFEGIRVRSIESALQTDIYTSLGAIPVVLSWGDVYTSLQSDVVSAVSSTTITNMYTANFYEVAKYFTLTNQCYSPAPLVCNLKMWNELPSDIQDLVMECAAEATAYQYEVCDQQLADARASMEEAGSTFFEIDITEWADAVAPLYEKYIGSSGITAELVAAFEAEVDAAQ